MFSSRGDKVLEVIYGFDHSALDSNSTPPSLFEERDQDPRQGEDPDGDRARKYENTIAACPVLLRQARRLGHREQRHGHHQKEVDELQAWRRRRNM